MDYKEKIEPRPATAADSIADGLGKNLSFDASDSTPRQPRKYARTKIGLAPAASIIRERLSRNCKMVGVTRLNPPQSIHNASGEEIAVSALAA